LGVEDSKQQISHIGEIISKLADKQPLHQDMLTRFPAWYTTGSSMKKIIVALLLQPSKLDTDTSQESEKEIGSVSTLRLKEDTTFLRHIKGDFNSIFNPTRDELLAIGYIKVASALLPSFRDGLYHLFGSNQVMMGSIKRLARCKAKCTDYPFPGSPAAYICDYLRATVVCASLQDMVSALEKLHSHGEIFRLMRIKMDHLQTRGVILVNLEVTDTNIMPKKYSWSTWWDNQPLKMIAEVQITTNKLFDLSKMTHSLYEIERTNHPAEWAGLHRQGYGQFEKEMFPKSPLFHDPLFLL